MSHWKEKKTSFFSFQIIFYCKILQSTVAEFCSYFPLKPFMQLHKWANISKQTKLERTDTCER